VTPPLDLEHVEALLLVLSGLSVMALALVFLVRRSLLDRASALLLLGAGACAVAWKAPLFIGLSEDHVEWPEIAETGFFFLMAAALFAWSGTLFAVHADRLRDELVVRGRAERDLRQALDRGELLVDILSHDVKSFLAMSLPRIELLQQELPDAREPLERVRAPLERGVDVIENALLLMRLEAVAPVAAGRVDALGQVRDALAATEPVARPKNVRLTLVAPTRSDVTVSPLFANVLTNLLSNAVKWSPEGGTVATRIVASGERLRIEVTDQGPGVTAERRALLFQRFSRLDSVGVPGTGLGLAVASRIVALHGGTLSYEDAPGGGATFVLSVPVGIEP
jgi:signal transduction histidine kinase